VARACGVRFNNEAAEGAEESPPMIAEAVEEEVEELWPGTSGIRRFVPSMTTGLPSSPTASCKPPGIYNKKNTVVLYLFY